MKSAEIHHHLAIVREMNFYKDLLHQITEDKRKTRARRLAESGLIFFEQLKREAAKRHHK